MKKLLFTLIALTLPLSAVAENKLEPRETLKEGAKITSAVITVTAEKFGKEFCAPTPEWMKQAEKVIDECYLDAFADRKQNTAAIDVCMLGDMLFYTQANKIRELNEAKSQPDPTKDFPYWSKTVFEKRFDLKSYASDRFGYYFLQNQPLFKAYFTDVLDDTIRQIHTAQPNCSQ